MKKYENFCKSLKNLQLVRAAAEPYDIMTLTGSTALYGICFEQAWKAMKEVLLAGGYPEGQTGSPRQVLKLAYSVGMVQDERLWLEMLAARNDVAHSYNEQVARSLVERVKAEYIAALESLQTELEAHWL